MGVAQRRPGGGHAGQERLALGASRFAAQTRENTAQILIFGVAIMLLLVMVLIRTALIDEWRSQVPEDAANHFVMNIAEDEVDGVRELCVSGQRKASFSSR